MLLKSCTFVGWRSVLSWYSYVGAAVRCGDKCGQSSNTSKSFGIDSFTYRNNNPTSTSTPLLHFFFLSLFDLFGRWGGVHGGVAYMEGQYTAIKQQKKSQTKTKVMSSQRTSTGNASMSFQRGDLLRLCKMVKM
jgi:hypothetical protein